MSNEINDLDTLKAAVEKLTTSHTQHKIFTYFAVGMLTILVFFAVAGFYFLFGAHQDDAAANAKLAANQAAITQKMTEIAAANTAITEVTRQLAANAQAQAQTINKFIPLLAQASKPLPQPVQDQFFTSRGLVPSTFQPDGGRLFGSSAVVGLQTKLVEGEKCEELSAEKDVQITKQNDMISLYKSQVDNYVNVDALRQEELKTTTGLLKDTQKQLKRQKFWKYFWITTASGIAGYTGYEIGHKR